MILIEKNEGFVIRILDCTHDSRQIAKQYWAIVDKPFHCALE